MLCDSQTTVDPNPALMETAQDCSKIVENKQTYMHVVAILICHNEQGSEGMSVLELHGSWGVQHGEAADARHKCVAQHAHAQQGCDPDGCHEACQTQVHHWPCNNTLPSEPMIAGRKATCPYQATMSSYNVKLQWQQHAVLQTARSANAGLHIYRWADLV